MRPEDSEFWISQQTRISAWEPGGGYPEEKLCRVWETRGSMSWTNMRTNIISCVRKCGILSSCRGNWILWSESWSNEWVARVSRADLRPYWSWLRFGKVLPCWFIKDHALFFSHRGAMLISFNHTSQVWGCNSSLWGEFNDQGVKKTNSWRLSPLKYLSSRLNQNSMDGQVTSGLQGSSIEFCWLIETCSWEVKIWMDEKWDKSSAPWPRAAKSLV
jgi:hypothetical protein